MAINGYFFDALFDEETQTYDREYSAGMMTDYLKGIVGNGVIPNPSTSLQVVADSNLDITVGIGNAWIEGKKLENTAIYNLSLDSADPILNRIDRVIAVIDFANRLPKIEILKGTSAANPTAPALTRNDSRYELCLAEIYVSKGATAITQANITDTRANTTICGWATSLIQQVDTATLFTQWQTAYENYYAETKTELDAFMETLTEELGVTTFIKEYKKRATIAPGGSNVIQLDMSGYTYADSDIIDVYINGWKGSVEGEDYTIDSSGTSITLGFEVLSDDVQQYIDIRALKSVIGIEQSVNN